MPLLTAAAAPTLTTIATELLEQCLAFGRLSQNWVVTQEKMKRITPRIGLTLLLLQALEGTASLKFGDHRLPYLWNSISWTDEGPPAGHMPDDSAPLPSEVLQTLFAGWVAASNDNYPAARPLKAVLVHARRHGLPAALGYLTDLNKFGFVPDRSHREWVLSTLLSARAQVDRDDQVADLLLPNFSGWDSAAMLVRATPDLSWLDDDALHRVAGEPRCAELLKEVLQAGLTEVAGLRAAASLDEWTLRQAAVGAVLHDLLFSARLVRPRSIGLTAALGQLEEIYADTASFAAVLMMGLDRGPTDGLALLTSCRRVILAVNDELHGGIRNQRVLGPGWLEELLVRGDVPEPEWQRLTITLMVALGMFFPKTEHNVHLPARIDGADTEAVRGEVKAIYSDLRGALERGAADQRALVAVCRRGLELCPWSPTFRGELAIALDRDEHPDKALPLIAEAVVLDPTNNMYWQSLAVVLGRLAQPEEARLAGAIRSFLEERNLG